MLEIGVYTPYAWALNSFSCDIFPMSIDESAGVLAVRSK